MNTKGIGIVILLIGIAVLLTVPNAFKLERAFGLNIILLVMLVGAGLWAIQYNPIVEATTKVVKKAETEIQESISKIQPPATKAIEEVKKAAGEIQKDLKSKLNNLAKEIVKATE